jgi:hypothetical protein
MDMDTAKMMSLSYIIPVSSNGFITMLQFTPPVLMISYDIVVVLVLNQQI